MYVKVRHIEKGINPSSVHDTYFTGDYLGKGFRIGIVAGLVALTVSDFILDTNLFFVLEENYLFGDLRVPLRYYSKPIS